MKSSKAGRGTGSTTGSETMERWRGRVAVVTGATSGIGWAIAEALAQQGVHVWAGGRRRERLEHLRKALPEDLCHTEYVDMRDEQSIADFFERVKVEAGGADILVNNAGLGYEAPLLSGRTESWREMLEVNVVALAIATRAAVAQMSDEGHIIHISSLAAHRLGTGGAMYSASKWAVRALTEGLRRELVEARLPIRVTAISPGFVETEFHGNFFSDDERAKATYTQYRVLDPEDIARSVIHALAQPSHVQIHDILLRSREQPT